MALNDSGGLGQEIELMLDKVEQKIREIRELNRPSLEALDKQEIERRIKALEQRDEADRQAINEQLRSWESQINFIYNRFYIVLLSLLAICGIFAFFIDVNSWLL